MKGSNNNLLRGICVSIVYSDKKVRFAGVVDSSGKLLIGEYREMKQDNNCHHNKPPFFYFHLITSGIGRWKDAIEIAGNNTSELHFKVLELGSIKLAIAQLTKRSQSYLCVHIDSSIYFGKIISKICKYVNIPRITEVTSQ